MIIIIIIIQNVVFVNIMCTYLVYYKYYVSNNVHIADG